MPKTTPVPESDKQRILQLKEIHPEWSGRKIAKLIGLHQKTVNRILNMASIIGEVSKGLQTPVSTKPEKPVLSETSEITGDTWTITLPKTRIHTEKELLEYFDVDTRIWEVEKLVCNKWEMGYISEVSKTTSGEVIEETRQAEALPLFQVKAFLKRKKDVEAVIKEISELKEQAKTHSPKPPFVVRTQALSDLMLELNFPDAHLGKLAWGVETGHSNYDVKIAEQVYWTALETVLERVEPHNFDHILYVVGNDLLNSDDIEGRTTSGTYVSSDARYHKTFGAVRNLMVKSIERLRQISPVKVMIVSGNHDQLSCWHMGDSLECFFHNYEDVEIDNLPRARKYHEFGNVGLMFTHGHKGKRTDYPALMAAEQPKMWGRTKYRECHTGHLHMTKTDEQHGFRTRILPSLTAPDDWLATNGFVGNLRNAEGYVWSKQEGLIGQVYYTVPE